jgi:hypothetical protein
MTSRSLGVFVAALFSVQAVTAGDPAKPDEGERLVQQLSSQQFAEREAAAKELIARGTAAKAAVLTGTKHSDPEVAQRCKSILEQVRTNERRDFIAGKADWPSPSGKKFRDIVGDNDASRKLFAEVLADENRAAIVDKVGDSADLASRAYASEVLRLDKAALKATPIVPALPSPRDALVAAQRASKAAVGPGDVALVLFLGALREPSEAEPPLRHGGVLSASFIELGRGAMKDPMCKLYLAWLDRQSDPDSLVAGLEGSLYVPIPEAAKVARRLLLAPKASEGVLLNCYLVLGYHGKSDDLALLVKFRNDERVLAVHGSKDSQKIDIQVRDLAAAMSLKLRGQDPVVYGFPSEVVTRWWAAPDPFPFKNPLPFKTPQARGEAMQRAWAWLDQRAKPLEK